MKKPEKKDTKPSTFSFSDDMRRHRAEGYNRCIDDYEAFLPSEEEIEKLAEGILKHYNLTKQILDYLAKAISKRIRG